MNRPITYACLLFLAGPALPADRTTVPAATTDRTQAQAKLEQIRGRIAALTGRLGSELKDRDTLAAQVRQTELTVTDVRRRLETLRAAQLAAEHRRSELRSAEAHEMKALDAQRAALAAEIRAAYLIGGQEPLKLLLNQADPASVGRTLQYYGYFALDRGAKLEEIAANLQRVRESVDAVQQVSAQLELLQSDTQREAGELQTARARRVAALAAVTERVTSGHEELERLKREEQAEEALVADLARVLQDFPVGTEQRFDTQHGRLPWPVPGKITAHYQDARAAAGQSGLRWNGVLIESSRGAKVRAPYFGRVVYSDWLQGLGLLIIIGHRGGYMTLYGHAEVLYKSVGDRVSPGDVIAALSESGSNPPQLYFEIRDGRKAVDPKIYLKAAP